MVVERNLKSAVGPRCIKMKDYMIITPAEKNRHKFRVKVLKLKQENPSLSIRALAALTGSSYGKTYSVIKAASDLGIVEMRQIVHKPSKRNNKRLAIDVEEVLQMRIDDPTISLQKIGDAMGCSRERIRQILSKHDPNYNADNTLALRHKTFRNCTECDKWLPASATGRKDGICVECRTARRLAKKYSKFICPQCGDEFIMREREYYWRQVRKQQYIDKIGSSKEVTPVTCSYTCATRLRKLGETDGWGSQRHKDYMKSKRKYTPEILEFIVEARKNKTSYADIVKQLKDTFNLDTTIGTLGNVIISLKSKKLLGEE